MSSPCIGICQLDDATGYCIGCGRTIEEISGWGSASPDTHQRTLEQLPERMNDLPTASDTGQKSALVNQLSNKTVEQKTLGSKLQMAARQ
jgi:predicted Fe-S protein YdhL (DUF1289 family)